MVVNASNREKIVAWLKQHMVGKNVTLDDQTETTTMIAVQGPKAVELMKNRFAADATVLKYYYAMPTRYQDKPCVVSRTGYTGEDGFEIMIGNSLGLTCWNEFVAAGSLPCGLGARDTLRLEAAMPLYGHELTESINPLEAGLGWAVKLAKGDFIGRAALQNAKVDKVRIGLELEGKRAAREGSGIRADQTPIGTVTSGSFVPYLEKSIAMGYVLPRLSKPGTNLDIEIRGSHVPAKIVELPFYQRAK